MIAKRVLTLPCLVSLQELVHASGIRPREGTVERRRSAIDQGQQFGLLAAALSASEPALRGPGHLGAPELHDASRTCHHQVVDLHALPLAATNLRL
jgi:hypothetical protein